MENQILPLAIGRRDWSVSADGGITIDKTEAGLELSLTHTTPNNACSPPPSNVVPPSQSAPKMSMRDQAKDSNEAELPATHSSPTILRLSPPALEYFFNEELDDGINSLASLPVESLGLSVLQTDRTMAGLQSPLDEGIQNDLAPGLPLLEYTNERGGEQEEPAFVQTPFHPASSSADNGRDIEATEHDRVAAPSTFNSCHGHRQQRDEHDDHALQQPPFDPSYNGSSADVFDYSQLTTEYFSSLPIQAASPVPAPPLPLLRMSRSALQAPTAPPQENHRWSTSDYPAVYNNDNNTTAHSFSHSDALVPNFDAPIVAHHHHHPGAHNHSVPHILNYPQQQQPEFPSSYFTLQGQIPWPAAGNAAPLHDGRLMPMYRAPGNQNVASWGMTVANARTAPAYHNGPHMHGPQGNAVAGPSRLPDVARDQPQVTNVQQAPSDTPSRGEKRSAEVLGDDGSYRWSARAITAYKNKICAGLTYECLWPCKEPNPVHPCNAVPVKMISSRIRADIASHMGAAHSDDGDAGSDGQFEWYSAAFGRKDMLPRVRCRWGEGVPGAAVCVEEFDLWRIAGHIYEEHAFQLPCGRCGSLYRTIELLEKHMKTECGPPPPKKQRRR
ncbi:hypothetical protein MKEN_00490600 [Mycena kentingensis (nom. inval.)]|nr:hypothetical protein MKEN_00490600 [Mycena kentingensis (nom. inval.)]